MDLKTFQDKYLFLIDEISISFIQKLDLAKNLKEAILYSYTAGGKRIRPLLLLATLHAFSEEVTKGLHTACSLEFIHTSSLIHDDLPAMDNDDFRRGKLTNHKVFGEAAAILAGDALLVNAFELITLDERIDDTVKVKLLSLLAHNSGARGMIGGQQLDIENEDKTLDLDLLKKINEHKTGKLIEFALLAAAIIAKKEVSVLNTLKQVSYHIGIAFQIQDDILDVVGNKSIIGKPIHSDEKNHKSTYVSLLGLERAKDELMNHYEKALNLLDSLAMNGELLKEIFKLIVERDK